MRYARSRRSSHVVISALVATLSGAVASALAGCSELPAPVARAPVAAAAPLVGEVDETTRGIVAIIIFDANGKPKDYGTGTLIAPNIVLTAHHVVASSINYPSTSNPCGITLGPVLPPAQVGVMTRTSIYPDPHAELAVSAVYALMAEPGEPEMCDHDMALVVLAEPLADVAPFPLDLERVVEGATLAPTDVPTDGVFDVVAPGMAFTQFGYGRVAETVTEGKGTRRRGERAALCATGDKGCYYALPSKEWMGDSGTCVGDSGGPAIADGKVIGVASRGSVACGPVNFISIRAWADWFRERLHAISAETGVAIPWLDAPECVEDADCEGAQRCASGSCVPLESEPVEATPEVMPETTPEPVAEAVPEAGPETTPETAVEAGPEATAEATSATESTATAEPVTARDAGCAGGRQGVPVALGISAALGALWVRRRLC